MIRSALTALLILACGPVHALSCIAPSIEDAFAFARDSEDGYLPVQGQFQGFDLRPEDKSPEPQDRVFNARFIGHVVTGHGKGRALDLPVQVTEHCLASWCGVLPPNVEFLTFLRRDTLGYHFALGPCGGNAFSEPTRAMTNTLSKCLRDMDCAPG